jgi:hypothetical protein
MVARADGSARPELDDALDDAVPVVSALDDGALDEGSGSFELQKRNEYGELGESRQAFLRVNRVIEPETGVRGDNTDFMRSVGDGGIFI